MFANEIGFDLELMTVATAFVLITNIAHKLEGQAQQCARSATTLGDREGQPAGRIQYHIVVLHLNAPCPNVSHCRMAKLGGMSLRFV